MRALVGIARGMTVGARLAVSSTALTAFGLALSQPVAAQVVSHIVVQGNKRVEAETIRSYVRIRPGERVTQDKLNESLQALFATGLFSDVRIVPQGSQLLVMVQENPVINQVVFEGNSKLKKEQLQQEIESKPRGVLTRAKVQSDVQRILELYRRTGRYNARVEPKVIDLPEGRANLVFEINEGEKTGVLKISFVGNQAYSDWTLRDVITTGESNFLSFLKTNDVYDPDRLAADQELLRRFYLSHGYADFRVVSASADYDEQRGGFYITFTLDEGPQYRFGAVDVESSIPDMDTARLRALVRTKPGAVYNAELVEKSVEDLTVEVAKRGYAFSQVRPRGARDPASQLISVTYVIEEGPRVYVERINIRGNVRTQEEVIRREFELAEGDPYNKAYLDRTERRLKAMGYFKEVKITNEPGSAPDRVVLNVDVQEEPTGNISLGGGYSTSDGWIADVSLTERNFLGRGQFLRVGVGYGQYRKSADFSFTEPYFMGQRISFGFDLFYRDQNLQNTSSYNYRLYGGGIRFGLPITEELGFQTRYRISKTEIYDVFQGSCVQNSDGTCFTDENGNTINYPPASAAFLQLNNTSYITSAAGYSLVWDGLDNKKNPHNGFYFNVSQDFAGLGGDARYMRSVAEARAYYEVLPDIVGLLKLEGGHILGFGEGGLRVTDQFFKGGETVRGFKTAGFGPRDITNYPNTRLDAVGGTVYAAGTLELQFPFWGIPKELGLRGAVFADAGTLFDPSGIPSCFNYSTFQVVTCGTPGATPTEIANDKTIRSSVGGSILWQSPFGPLRADFAYPITKSSFDQTQVFRFSGGTSF